MKGRWLGMKKEYRGESQQRAREWEKEGKNDGGGMTQSKSDDDAEECRRTTQSDDDMGFFSRRSGVRKERLDESGGLLGFNTELFGAAMIQVETSSLIF